MKKLAAHIFCISFSFLTTSVIAGDLIADCENCHGKDGNSEDSKVPNIAGQAKQYILDSFDAYKEGDRKALKYKPENGEEEDMAEIANELSADDLEKVATHFAGKTFKMHMQKADDAMADKGAKKFDQKCEKCHSEKGTLQDDEAGILLGQHKEYMAKQFEFFDSGERRMPKKMKKKFKKLSDEDKANIIEFLARGK